MVEWKDKTYIQLGNEIGKVLNQDQCPALADGQMSK